MKRTWLFLALLLAVNASLATVLESWFRDWEGNRAGSRNVLEIALGDGRKLFARHAYAKADAYFHNGYYPSIFDTQAGFDQDAHLNAEVGLQDGAGEGAHEGDFLGKPRDWIEAFGRHFYPSVHSHLGEEPCGHEGPCEHKLVHRIGGSGPDDVPAAHNGHEDHEAHESADDHEKELERQKKLQREILPWLRLSVELDPQRIETYVVGAYWLRRNLEKPGEAEQFLREGLRANPNNPEILFELGRIQAEVMNEPERAQNLYELALRYWRERPLAARESSEFLHAQLLGNLARLNEQAGRRAQALEYLRELKEVSLNPAPIEKWIGELEGK